MYTSSDFISSCLINFMILIRKRDPDDSEVSRDLSVCVWKH